MLLLPILSLSACLLFESAEVVFPTGQAPLVEIISPAEDEILYAFNENILIANVQDKDTPLEEITITLNSSLDGSLNLDNSMFREDIWESELILSLGIHTLTLSATDLDGHVTTDEVLLSIIEDNTAPTCFLSSPAEGDSVSSLQEILLSGYTSDDESPLDTLTVSFASDIDGPLGTTTPFTDGSLELPITLSNNAHQVTMTVTDPGGESCSVTHQIYASSGPIVRITHPLNGAILYPDDEFSFKAIIEESVEDPIEIQIEWSSSIAGTLYQDTPDSDGVSSFTANPLSAGEHEITFTAIDSSNAVGRDTINLIVNLPPVINLIEFLPNPVSPNELIICRVEASNPDGAPPVLSFVLQNQSTGTVYSPTLVKTDYVMLDLSTVNDVQAGDVIACTVTATDEYNSSISSEAFVTVITRDTGGTTETRSQ